MVNRDRITQQSPPLAIQDPDLGRPRRIRPTRCFSPSPGLAATATRQQRLVEGPHSGPCSHRDTRDGGSVRHGSQQANRISSVFVFLFSFFPGSSRFRSRVGLRMGRFRLRVTAGSHVKGRPTCRRFCRTKRCRWTQNKCHTKKYPRFVFLVVGV